MSTSDPAESRMPRLRLTPNPLDELDTLNHYAFAGRRDMTRQFRVLTVNDGSPGEETLFLAAQLSGTDSLVVHYDSSPLAVERVRRRARDCAMDVGIRFTSAPLPDLLAALRSRSKLLAQHHGTDISGDRGFPLAGPSDYGPFDYVRCCDALDRSADPEGLLGLMCRFLKKNGVLGISCPARHGREPYRQMRELLKRLTHGLRGADEKLACAKEFFAFAPPEQWTRKAFDNLRPEVRAFQDAAFAQHFLTEETFVPDLPALRKLLLRFSLEIVEFSRETRRFYQPWFANRDPELVALLQRLTPEDQQAVAEIAWGTVERHHFWASRPGRALINPLDSDMIPFFNRFSRRTSPGTPHRKRPWRDYLLHDLPEESSFELPVELAANERYAISVPWTPALRRFVRHVDGYKTLGEIALVLREELFHISDGDRGIQDYLREIAEFRLCLDLEDVLLLRHKNAPLLPLTARPLEAA